MNLNDLKIKVKQEVDLKSFLEKEGIVFKQVSASNSVALCPFHSEKTPSFTVSDTFQTYKCFGCGASGDIFTYVQEKEAIDWKDSVVYVAKMNGIKFELDNENENYSQYSRFYEVISILEDFFKEKFNNLNEFHPAKKMITDRNLSINSFEYGYAPYDSNETLNYLFNKGVTEEELIELKLLSKKGYFMFKNRLIFFIRNYMGKTIGFTGRALSKEDEENRKYVNSGDSLIYHKKNIIFNIEKAKYKARKEEKIYLVEGQFDVVAMTENNFENVVAVSGTSITEEHIKEIIKAVGSDGKIVLLLDGDKAGIKAAVKVFQLFPQIHNQLYIIKLYDDLDPCDFLKTGQKLPKEELFIEFYYQKLRDSKVYVNTSQKNEFINDVQKLITQFIKNKTLKEQYLRRACIFVDVKYEDLQIYSNNKQTQVVSNQNDDKDDTIILNNYEKYYMTAINLLINNQDIFPLTKENLKSKEYPENLLVFLKAIVNKKIQQGNNYERFKPFIKFLETLPTDRIDDVDLLLSHYSSLLKYASKLRRKEEKKQNIQRAIIEIEKTDNISDAISVLKGLDDISK